MLELMSYGLTGLVSILLIVFCFVCKDDTPSSDPMYDAELRHPKPVERCARAANGDTGPQSRKHKAVLNG